MNSKKNNMGYEYTVLKSEYPLTELDIPPGTASNRYKPPKITRQTTRDLHGWIDEHRASKIMKARENGYQTVTVKRLAKRST